jgi:5-methyltetrahydrofolate--homocysteine methyltransferase
LDGGVHDTAERMEYDDNRTFELEEKGFRVLRFRNEEIITNIEYVLSKIKDYL